MKTSDSSLRSQKVLNLIMRSLHLVAAAGTAAYTWNSWGVTSNCSKLNSYVFRNLSLSVEHIITVIILCKQKWHAPHSEVMMTGLVPNHEGQKTNKQTTKPLHHSVSSVSFKNETSLPFGSWLLPPSCSSAAAGPLRFIVIGAKWTQLDIVNNHVKAQ